MTVMGKIQQKVVRMIRFLFGFLVGCLFGVFSLTLLVGGKYGGKK